MRSAALAFLIGIVFVQQLPTLPSLIWALALIPLVLLAWRFPRVWPLVFLIGGVVWVSFRAGLILAERLPAELEGVDLTLTGVVADIPQATDYGTRFEFAIVDAKADAVPVATPSRILLTSALRDFTPRAGETWRLRARLKRPHGFQNPGGFDYEAYLFRSRIGATGYVRGEENPQQVIQGSGRFAIDALRQRLGERIAALTHSDYAGLVVALANGDGRGISDTQWEVLRQTGTLHLVAISGLHISLIGGIAFFLGRFLWALPGFTVLRLPAPHAGAIAAMVAATLYAALAGFVIPTQRALIMLAVAMLAIGWRRHVAPSQILAIALLAVLVHDPLAVMAPGFWLSFAAVAVILYVAQGATPRTLWRRWGYLQLAIAIGMLPLMLWLFQQVSLVAPFANLVAVPVFDVLAVPLTLGGVGLLGMGFESAAAFLFNTAATLLQGLWVVLDFLATFKLGQWTQHRPSTIALLCALVGVVWLLAPRGWPARWVGAVWLLPMLWIRPPTPATGELWFTLLDVGQGLAAVVRTEHHVMVYDTGARFSARFDAGRAVVAPYLRAQGVERVDRLIVSHGDNDHIGGAASLLRLMSIANVQSSVPERLGADRCVAGERWEWDAVEFVMLNPPYGSVASDNDGSCVLLIKSRYGRVLLPGDIAKRAERRLANTAEDLAADILVVPHHGSKSSSTEEFIAAVRPRYAFFPVGYRNRYRHPHPQVIERYAVLGAHRYDSATSGALEVRLRADGIAVEAYRERARRYWFATPLPPSAN